MTHLQRKGIGRELIRPTHEAAGRRTTLVLLAAPKARSYHPHIGMRPHDWCWVVDRQPSHGAKAAAAPGPASVASDPTLPGPAGG